MHVLHSRSLYKHSLHNLSLNLHTCIYIHTGKTPSFEHIHHSLQGVWHKATKLSKKLAEVGIINMTFNINVTDNVYHSRLPQKVLINHYDNGLHPSGTISGGVAKKQVGMPMMQHKRR